MRAAGWLAGLLALATACHKEAPAPSCQEVHRKTEAVALAELAARGPQVSEGTKALVKKTFAATKVRCLADKWSADVRRCLGGATTVAQVTECSQRLSDKQRNNLEAALALKPMPTPTQNQLARIELTKLAMEAFPQWAAAHPDRACPGGIEELREYALVKATDPWGHPYRLSCGAQLPAGAEGIAVSSDGADGQAGTEDDLKSWE